MSKSMERRIAIQTREHDKIRTKARVKLGEAMIYVARAEDKLFLAIDEMRLLSLNLQRLQGVVEKYRNEIAELEPPEDVPRTLDDLKNPEYLMELAKKCGAKVVDFDPLADVKGESDDI